MASLKDLVLDLLGSQWEHPVQIGQGPMEQAALFVRVGEAAGPEWQWREQGAPCYTITDGSTAPEWVLCIYKNGEVVLLDCDELATCYVAPGYQPI